MVHVRTRIIVAIAGLVAGYVAAVFAAERPGIPTLVRVAFAAIAAAAFLVFIVVEVGVIRDLDELERRIQLEAFAIAFPTALLLVFSLGMLERAGIHVWGLRQLRDVWPLILLPYGVGLVVAMRRYR